MKIKRSTQWTVVAVTLIIAFYLLTTLLCNITKGVEFWFGWTVGGRIGFVLLSVFTSVGCGLAVKLLAKPGANGGLP